MVKRPVFHFTPQKNWMNDPNGLVFDNGTWHMFFQYDPYGKASGNRAWGHAISTDLLHWKELEPALMPWDYQMFSGSAAMDTPNTLGLNTAEHTTMLLAVSEFRYGMCIHYSTDGGNSFTKLTGKALIPCPNRPDRDPKLFFYEKGQYWVMMFYGEMHARSGIPGYVFYKSINLTDWEYMSEVPSNFECPDMRLLNVENADEKKWTILAGNTDTLIGDFDGQKFELCQPKDKSLRVYQNYAPQTWNNTPNDRVIQQNWLTGPIYPDIEWSQQMAFPVDLSLRKTNTGYKLLHRPIPEIQKLWSKTYNFENIDLLPGHSNIFKDINGDAFDIEYEFEYNPTACVALCTPNGRLEHNGFEPCIRLHGRWETCNLTENNTIKVRVLIDTDSIEVFGSNDEVYMCFTQEAQPSGLSLDVFDGKVKLVRARVSVIE